MKEALSQATPSGDLLRTITILLARATELAINANPALYKTRLIRAVSHHELLFILFPIKLRCNILQVTTLLERHSMHGPAGTSDNDDRCVCLLGNPSGVNVDFNAHNQCVAVYPVDQGDAIGFFSHHFTSSALLISLLYSYLTTVS